MAALKPLLDEYLAGPRLLREAVAGLSSAALKAHPIAGKWSIREVVCHLVDFEPILADRMKRVIAEEQPSLIGADETRFAAVLAYDQRDLEEELTIFDMTRRQMARILQTLPDSILARTGVHSERGTLTLERILLDTIRHVPHHLAFIREKRQMLETKS